MKWKLTVYRKNSSDLPALIVTVALPASVNVILAAIAKATDDSADPLVQALDTEIDGALGATGSIVVSNWPAEGNLLDLADADTDEPFGRLERL